MSFCFTRNKGLVVGLFFMLFTHSDLNNNILDKDIQLSADFFYMVLLPPIIFEVRSYLFIRPIDNPSGFYTTGNN